MLEKVNLAEECASLDAHWVPRSVAGYNGDHVQVLKVVGEYVWHSHDRTDDLFLVLLGRVTVQLRDGDVVLERGEMLVVPVGTEHCVRADEEAHVLVLEHLGDVPVEAGEPSLAAPLFM